VRDLLTEADAASVSMADVAANLTADNITAHLYTVGRPGPDLVIRTSDEQRLSNFLHVTLSGEAWHGVGHTPPLIRP
jgi:short-chain Z-isoprenyl diphosphate synthase